MVACGLWCVVYRSLLKFRLSLCVVRCVSAGACFVCRAGVCCVLRLLGCWMLAEWCVLFVVCVLCLLFDVMLSFVVRCLLFVVRWVCSLCDLGVGCCLLFVVVCCLAICDWRSSCVDCCTLLGVCRLLCSVCWLLFAYRCV